MTSWYQKVCYSELTMNKLSAMIIWCHDSCILGMVNTCLNLRKYYSLIYEFFCPTKTIPTSLRYYHLPYIEINVTKHEKQASICDTCTCTVNNSLATNEKEQSENTTGRANIEISYFQTYDAYDLFIVQQYIVNGQEMKYNREVLTLQI